MPRVSPWNGFIHCARLIGNPYGSEAGAFSAALATRGSMDTPPWVGGRPPQESGEVTAGEARGEGPWAGPRGRRPRRWSPAAGWKSVPQLAGQPAGRQRWWGIFSAHLALNNTFSNRIRVWWGDFFWKPHQNEFFGKSKSAPQHVRQAAAHNYARRVYESEGLEREEGQENA